MFLLVATAALHANTPKQRSASKMVVVCDSARDLRHISTQRAPGGDGQEGGAVPHQLPQVSAGGRCLVSASFYVNKRLLGKVIANT
jgi:hypothetical protein